MQRGSAGFGGLSTAGSNTSSVVPKAKRIAKLNTKKKAEFPPKRKSLLSGRNSGMFGCPVSLDFWAVSLAASALLRKLLLYSIFTGFVFIFFPSK